MQSVIIHAIGNALDPITLLYMVFGIVVGIVIGSLPGLTAALAVALMLPFTFGLRPEVGLLMLIGVYCAGIYGGSISAVLIKTPGTPASVATVEDGYALTRKGRAADALNVSLYASVVGGLTSGIALLLVAPQLARFALRFGAPEYFTLAIFGLTVIAGVFGESVLKGLMMAALGLLISTIGMDAFEGQPRFMFGFHFLYSGIELVPALTGLFAISEVFRQIEIRAKSLVITSELMGEKRSRFGWRNMKSLWRTMIRSSLIGIVIGTVPGTGGAISSFISYNRAKQKSRTPEQFGHGSLEGIAASEAGNNGTTGATLIPMLTLGIPGDTVTAILLGALLIHGISPGPRLFTDNAPLVYTVMIGFVVVNVLMFFVAKGAIRWITAVTRVPPSFLLPAILLLSVSGAYANSNAMHSVGIALVFGVLGYLFNKFRYPIPPLFIAMVLGSLAEVSLRQSLLMSRGRISIFFTRPISLFFVFLIALSVFIPVLKRSFFRGEGSRKGNQR